MTKNNPGRFDCYENAHPDEPLFVLLGRDPWGADLVRLWANAREGAGEDPGEGCRGPALCGFDASMVHLTEQRAAEGADMRLIMRNGG